MDFPRRSVPKRGLERRRPNAPTAALFALTPRFCKSPWPVSSAIAGPTEMDPAMRLAPEQREVTDDCRTFDEFADPDGIVCLLAARGESNAADRLRGLLAHAYGQQWSTTTERALLEATGPRPPKSLEDWLRDHFFQEHCRLFHNRPFIWHIWDGRKDGFHALVNYHRLAGPERRRPSHPRVSHLRLPQRMDRATADGPGGRDPGG